MRITHDLFLTTACLLAAPFVDLSAQSHISVPPRFVTLEAGSYCQFLGSTPEFRAQVGIGTLRGRARSLRRLDLRAEGGRSPGQAAARSFRNVQLRLGPGDLSTFSRTFASNLDPRAVTVFNGPMNWPGSSAVQPTPAPWGVEVSFPFQVIYADGGTTDLLLDFEFAGGTMRNGKRWLSIVDYRLDGVRNQPANTASVTALGTPSCSNFAGSPGARCEPLLQTFAADSGSPNSNNRFAFSWELSGHPQGTTVALGASLMRGTPTGVDIGNACNRLFMPMGPQMVQLFDTPIQNTSMVRAPGRPIYAPYNVNFVGARVYTQAAYMSPQRQRFELSAGGTAILPPQPTPIRGMLWTWAINSQLPSGTQPNQYYMPLLRFTY